MGYLKEDHNDFIFFFCTFPERLQFLCISLLEKQVLFSKLSLKSMLTLPSQVECWFLSSPENPTTDIIYH